MFNQCIPFQFTHGYIQANLAAFIGIPAKFLSFVLNFFFKFQQLQFNQNFFFERSTQMGSSSSNSNSDNKGSRLYLTLHGRSAPSSPTNQTGSNSGGFRGNHIAPNSLVKAGMTPLPQGWQAFRNRKNEIYFLNQNTKEETSIDPRPLPNGWNQHVTVNDDNLEKTIWINNELRYNAFNN